MQEILATKKHAANHGRLITMSPRIGRISQTLGGVSDERLVMVRLNFERDCATLVYVLDQIDLEYIRIKTDDPEITAAIPVPGQPMAIRFFESPTSNVLRDRRKLIASVDALLQMKRADGRLTRGVILGGSAGRAFHEQYMQVGGTVETVGSIRSIRYDHRRNILVGIKLLAGRFCRDVVMFPLTARVDPDEIHDPKRWTVVATVSDVNIVSLSGLRVRPTSTDVLVNLQNGECHHLVIKASGEVIWGQKIAMSHIALRLIPGFGISGYEPHRGGIEFMTLRSLEQVNPLAVHTFS